MKIIIHGGLLDDATAEELRLKREALKKIVGEAYELLKTGTSKDAVVFAVQQLENDPLFNAGTGSKIQQDGIIRMSASLMEGDRQAFSGVINIKQVQNPIIVANKLQDEDDKVLSDDGAVKYAMQHGVEAFSVETPHRREEFNKQMDKKRTGTVGCVAIDKNGIITAGTSTGGKGLEFVGRVSDSATVAGNFANAHCGVSCTGIGEDIVNSGLAVKIVTRVTDGYPIDEAAQKSLNELLENDGEAGIICIDKYGNIFHGYSQNNAPVSYAWTDGKTLETY